MREHFVSSALEETNARMRIDIGNRIVIRYMSISLNQIPTRGKWLESKRKRLPEKHFDLTKQALLTVSPFRRNSAAKSFVGGKQAQARCDFGF